MEKAAYALKARLTMHLLNRASDKTASLNTVLDCISKSFESSSEELNLISMMVLPISILYLGSALLVML